MQDTKTRVAPHMEHISTTYNEYMKCLRAPKKKSAGVDGVPPHLLRHLPHHIQKQLYQAILDV